MEVRIGVVGLGKMGSAIAARLTHEGMVVSGWTRSGVDQGWSRENGVTDHGSLAGLVENSDVILTSLFDDAAVSSVFAQLLECDLAGKLVVETSTINPKVVTSHSDQFQTTGASLLDAPISGGPNLVSLGKAGVFIGGDTPQVARFMPVAERFSDRIIHVGALGQGLGAKIVNNMMLASYWQCLRETLDVGQSIGLTGRTMLDILTNGPAANGVLAGKIGNILGTEAQVAFTVEGIAKDLAMFDSVARDGGIETPALRAALASFNRYRDLGHGASDFATMPGEVLKG